MTPASANPVQALVVRLIEDGKPGGYLGFADPNGRDSAAWRTELSGRCRA